MTLISESRTINIEEKPSEAIESGVRTYFSGGIMIYPTDTIYGLGCNPFNEEAVSKISKLKQRDERKHYILLIGDMQLLMKYIEIKSEVHLDFLNALWPNPVSVILKLNEQTKNLWGTEDVAFRIPNHNFCRKLLNELRAPLISTSVNKSGEPPINDFSQIVGSFADFTDLVLYGTSPQLNQSSTLIRLTGTRPELLREGKIPFDEILSKFELASFRI